MLGGQSCDEFGKGGLARVIRQFGVFSATGSATSHLARRNLFVYTGCNGRRPGLQPGGWRFDPARLHLTSSGRSSSVICSCSRLLLGVEHTIKRSAELPQESGVFSFARAPGRLPGALPISRSLHRAVPTSPVRRDTSRVSDPPVGSVELNGRVRRWFDCRRIMAIARPVSPNLPSRSRGS